MLDSEQSAPNMVWGIPVSRKSNGSQAWPDVIKQMARERIAEGQKIHAIGREIGTTGCVVSRWCKDRSGAEIAASCIPSLVEVVAALDEPSSVERGAQRGISFNISLGDVHIVISQDFSSERLTVFLRAVRASL